MGLSDSDVHTYPAGLVRPRLAHTFPLVQDRLSGILQASWESEFRGCSYGFRPQRNAHQALKRLAEVITLDHTQWIVEADIKGFFDHVCHYHLQRFLAQRVSDPPDSADHRVISQGRRNGG
jgi:hypothetical protein